MGRKAFLVQEQLALPNKGGVMVNREEVTLEEFSVTRTIETFKQSRKGSSYEYMVLTMSLEQSFKTGVDSNASM